MSVKKSKTEELKEKREQMQKRVSTLDYKTISSQAIEDFAELQKLQPLKHQAFRMLPSDIETIRDITHTLKMNLDPYMTQSKALHLMVKFFQEAIGDEYEERPPEVKREVEKRSLAKKKSSKKRIQSQPPVKDSTNNSQDDDDGL